MERNFITSKKEYLVSTRLHVVAFRNEIKELRQLLDQAAIGVDTRANGGFTPLHYAAMNDSSDAATLLIGYGANTELTDDQGWTPRRTAETNNSHKVIDELNRIPEIVDSFRQAQREKAAGQRQAQIAAEQFERKKISALEKIKSVLQTDYTNVDQYFATHCAEYLSENDLDREKIALVKEWFTNRRNSSSIAIDDDQARAIGAISFNIQVTARAGSGKTSTIVNRALFLQEHCGISPGEILILAFNRSAAQEIEERFRKLLASEPLSKRSVNGSKSWDALGDNPDDTSNPTLASFSTKRTPHVMTFHSLAHAVVMPTSDTLGETEQNQVIQSIIDGQSKGENGQSLSQRLRDVMMSHFRKQQVTGSNPVVGSIRKSNVRGALRNACLFSRNGHNWDTKVREIGISTAVGVVR